VAQIARDVSLEGALTRTDGRKRGV